MSAQAVSEAAFAEMVRSQLHLFLSVDQEDSTRHKQQWDGIGWRMALADFVEDFPQGFRAQHSDLPRPGRTAPEIRIWRILGDEIVFRLEVTEHCEVAEALQAFVAALAHWNTPKNPERHRLQVKGTAWVAGFPVANAIAPIGNGDFDFLGPQMDAGFRVTKLSTPTRMAISVELAWLLAHFQCQHPLHFEGTVDLKGLAEGVGYPHLWMEVHPSEYHEQVAKLLGRAAPCPVSKLKRLCAAYLRQHAATRHLPFLRGEASTPVPDEYERDRRDIEKQLRDRYLLRPNLAPQPESRQSAAAEKKLLKTAL